MKNMPTNGATIARMIEQHKYYPRDWKGDVKNKTSSPPQENFGHGRGKRYIIENGEIVDCIPV